MSASPEPRSGDDTYDLIDDDEVKSELASAHPYGDWLAAASIHLDELPKRTLPALPHTSIVWHQRLFGYTHEELRLIIAPMASSAAWPSFMW